jgi:hypothetical protein
MGRSRRDPQAQRVVREECNHLQSPEATIATRVITNFPVAKKPNINVQNHSNLH